MKWKLPPKIKIYEALGAIGDGRIEMGNNSAKIFSSSGNKFYTVYYDPSAKAIRANDNGSYWQGYLGYPSIAFLMKIGAIKYDPIYAEALRGIVWKDINTKFKNDFDKTLEYVHQNMKINGRSLDDFLKEIEDIYSQIKEMNLNQLGKRTKPPLGY